MTNQAENRFGQIALEWKFCNREQIDRALAYQQAARNAGGRVPRLGEFLIASGALKPQQIRALLHGQDKEIVMCPSCSTRYNARHLKSGSRLICPRCHLAFSPLHSSLESSPPDEDVRADCTLALPPIQIPVPMPEHERSRIFIGSYKIQKRLGGDHSGVLYKALHPQTGNSVTLRLLSKQILDGPLELARWKKSGLKATELIHPNLQRILSMGSDGIQAYLVMEFIEGKSLRQRLAEKMPLPPLEAIEILLQTAAALEYGQVHHLIHGDLRPNHLLIGLDGRVRVSSLGTPKYVMKDLLLMCEAAGPVPLYTAPEVLIDENVSDERSDLYSLCAIGYHLFTGHPPREGREVVLRNMHAARKGITAPRRLVPNLPPYLERLLLKGLSVESEDRYHSIAEFIADLKKCRMGLQIQAPDLPHVAPELIPGSPNRIRRPFSHTLASNRLRTHWFNTGKTGMGMQPILTYPVSALPPGSATEGLLQAEQKERNTGHFVAVSEPLPGIQPIPGAPQTFASPLETRQLQAVGSSSNVGQRKAPARGFKLASSLEDGRRVITAASSRGAVLASLALFLVSTALILGFLYLMPRGKVPESREDQLARERGPRTEAAANADPIREDYFKLVEKPIKIDEEQPQTIVQSIDRFLKQYADRAPEPAQVKSAKDWRAQYAKQSMADSREKLQEQTKNLIAQDLYPEAIARVKEWQAEGGQAFQAAAAEEIDWIVSNEKQKAEAEFERIRGLAASQNIQAALKGYDDIAKRFNPELAARAMEEKAKLKPPEKGEAFAVQQKAKAEETEQQEERVRQKRETALLENLIKSVHEALGNLELKTANTLLEKLGTLAAHSVKEPEVLQLKEEAQFAAALRERMVSTAQQGRFRSMRVAYMGGMYGIMDAAAAGPVLDVKGGRMNVRWAELTSEERMELAERASDPDNAKHQLALGNYLMLLGQAVPAEKAFAKAQKLGEPASPWLARAREMQEQVISKRQESAPAEPAGIWEGADYVQGSLHAQHAGMQKALKSQGWMISQGFWIITPLGTLYGEWKDPALPLLSLKRELKRFGTLSVEMRGLGPAMGYSFGKGQRFLTKPSGRWQKLELQVTEGDILRFMVDGQTAQNLENPSKPVTSEQLPDILYLRCEGRLCEIRNFQVNGKELEGAEWSWDYVKPTHTPAVQSVKDQDQLNTMGWAISKGLWAITPGGGYLGVPQGDAAILQRDKPGTFRKLAIEFRGEGEAAGFSFGKGMRFLAKPTEKWQRLDLEIVMDDLLRMTVNGELRPSLDGTGSVKAIDLPKILYLRAQGGTVEFRGFSQDQVLAPTAKAAGPTSSPAQESHAARQDPAEAIRIQALGWEIAGGQWKVDGVGILTGARTPGSNLLSLKRKLPRFLELGVEMYGEGDLAGFSFGKGNRWVAKPIDSWQTLQLQVLRTGQLQLLVNGEVRDSIEDTHGIRIDQLGDTLYLHANAATIRFRHFKVDEAGTALQKQASASATVPASLVTRSPVPKTLEALKKMGWEIHAGKWEVVGEALEGETREGPEVSLKRNWKRGAWISVDVKGDGYAAGFSWDDLRYVVIRPTQEWQTLKIDVSGTYPILYVNGAQRAPLEDVKHILCDKLSETLYLRSVGGKVSFRNYKENP